MMKSFKSIYDIPNVTERELNVLTLFTYAG